MSGGSTLATAQNPYFEPAGTAGEWQPRENLPILRTQDDKRPRRLGIRIGRRWWSSRRWLSGRSPRRAAPNGAAHCEQDPTFHLYRNNVRMVEAASRNLTINFF